MSRGNRQESIFEDDEDRRLFLRTMGEVCGRTEWKIHAYVLMGNHYHWLLETPEANLVTGMQWFQSTYTVRHNVRHRKSGHLFQGRYKAVLVDPEEGGYFAAVADYVHLNPARAGLIGREGSLIDYQWSSYPWYAASRREERPTWLRTELVLGELGLEDRSGDRKRYCRRIEERAREGLEDEQLKQIRKGWVLGGEGFREQVLDWLEARGRNQDLPERKIRREETDEDHGQRKAERLIAASLGALGMGEEELARLRKGDWRKRVIAHGVRRRTTVSLRWLAVRLGMGSDGHLSRISSDVSDLVGRPEWKRYEEALRKNARKKD